MNIIFLDVDGVLNSYRYAIELYNQTHKPRWTFDFPFDKKCLENFKHLVEETCSSIVVESTWRKKQKGRETLLKELSKYKLDSRVIGYTPDVNGNKEKEIKEFLSNLQYKPNFIILDNNPKMGELQSHLIVTDEYEGLTSKNVEEGIIKLNRTTKKESERKDSER